MVPAPKTKKISGKVFKLARVSFSHIGQGKKWVTDGAQKFKREGKSTRILEQPHHGHKKYLLYTR